MGHISECKILQFPKIHDQRGNLTFIEGQKHVPFAIRRVYWIYDVPGGDWRGGHAYRQLEEVIVSISGSFDLVLDDGRDKWNFSLNRSYFGVYVPRMVWRQLENFSTNAVALVLASDAFSEKDYVRNYEDYRRLNA